MIWDTFCDNLKIISWAYGVRIHQFVLMDNHYHMIVDTPDENIDDAIAYLQREISKELNLLAGSQDFRFQGRYRWKLISNEYQYANTYRYVANNPVEGGLSRSAINYKYSSLNGQYGLNKLEIPIHKCRAFTHAVPEDLEDQAEWLGENITQVSA